MFIISAPESLKLFDPISLEEMGKAELMDRTDLKYMFRFEQLDFFLSSVAEYYKVLEINGKRLFRYETVYYDTKSNKLYRNHHDGIMNRFKVRHRTYVDSNLGFLEVKVKNNKGRTVKERIKCSRPDSLNDKDTASFICSLVTIDPSELLEKIDVNYDRITLVSKSNAERVTIDLNLTFVSGGNENVVDDLVIAELKRDAKMESPFLKLMRDNNVKIGSMSKYCMGMAVLDMDPKKNNFKEGLLKIFKLVKK
jgi:hypothetical protein